MKPIRTAVTYLVERRPCTLIRWSPERREVIAARTVVSFVTRDGEALMAFGTREDAVEWAGGRR